MDTSTAPNLWQLAGEALALLHQAAPGDEARVTPHAYLAISGDPVADLNYAVIDQAPDAAEMLREFARLFKARDLPIVVAITDVANPELAPIASELGLQHAGSMPLMTYQAEDIESGNAQRSAAYAMQRVTSIEDLGDVQSLVAGAFAMPLEPVSRAYGPGLLAVPEVDIFLARESRLRSSHEGQGNQTDDGAPGTPVSTVWTTNVGPIIGIWAMATPPEHQRKGAGRAVLQYAIDYHLERGAKSFYLMATEAGKPLYDRLGFQTTAVCQIWVAGHSTQVPGNS